MIRSTPVIFFDQLLCSDQQYFLKYINMTTIITCSIRSAYPGFPDTPVALPLLEDHPERRTLSFSMDELEDLRREHWGTICRSFFKAASWNCCLYARHDMKHILLDYDTTDEGEGCLQCLCWETGTCHFP